MYLNSICKQQGALTLVPGSHHLTSGKLIWIHQTGEQLLWNKAARAAQLNGTDADFSRRTLKLRPLTSPTAKDMTPREHATAICGEPGDAIFLDARAIHSRGNVSTGHERRTFHISSIMVGAKMTTYQMFGRPEKPPKSELAKTFRIERLKKIDIS